MEGPDSKNLAVVPIIGNPAVLPVSDRVRKTVVELPRHTANDDALSGGSPSSVRAGRGILAAVVMRSARASPVCNSNLAMG